MKVGAEFNTVEGCCGIALWNFYENIENPSEYAWGDHLVNLTPKSIKEKHNYYPGTGYALAAFVKGDKTSDEMYKRLKQAYTIVFESEVRHNNNSGNEFYFVIYDNNKTFKQIEESKDDA